MVIGAQLFTLREHCATLDAFSETLKKVADIGYTTVQVSGTCSFEAQWLKEQLLKNNLHCVLTHYDPQRIENDTQAVIDEHHIFGCDYIGIGCMPGALQHPDDYAQFVKRFHQPSKIIAQQHKYFMYHNHHFELMKAEDGKLYLEKLAQDFQPDELGFTLDTYWIQYAGGDPAAWIERLKGRVPCIHLKDMACVKGAQKMAPVGEGNINFDRVLQAAEQAGTKYLLVEQDDCNGEDPFSCLKRSYQYLKSKGLK